jgi:hypothetical protein
VRLVLDGEKVIAEEKLQVDRRQRIREVRQGPDGALYVFAGSSLLRLSPKRYEAPVCLLQRKLAQPDPASGCGDSHSVIQFPAQL